MHPQDLINQFVALRSKGISYDKIVEQLKIGKGTAVAWGRQYKAHIHNGRLVEFEAIQERLLGASEDRYKSLLTRLQALEQELAGRQPKYMPTLELQRVIAETRHQINQLFVEPAFLEEPPTAAPDSKP